VAGRRRRRQPAVVSIVNIISTAVDGSGTAVALPPVAPQFVLIRFMSQMFTMPSPLASLCGPPVPQFEDRLLMSKILTVPSRLMSPSIAA